MRPAFRIVPFVLAFSAAVPAARPAAAVLWFEPEHETGRLRGVEGAVDDFFAADNQNDIDRLALCFEEEGVWLPPTGEVVTGRRAISAWYRGPAREVDPRALGGRRRSPRRQDVRRRLRGGPRIARSGVRRRGRRCRRPLRHDPVPGPPERLEGHAPSLAARSVRELTAIQRPERRSGGPESEFPRPGRPAGEGTDPGATGSTSRIRRGIRRASPPCSPLGTLASGLFPEPGVRAKEEIDMRRGSTQHSSCPAPARQRRCGPRPGPHERDAQRPRDERGTGPARRHGDDHVARLQGARVGLDVDERRLTSFAGLPPATTP